MLKDRGIVLLALGQTFAWASIYYTFPALLLRWEQGLGWSKADLTAAITVAVLISALCSPITGRIIDKGRGSTLMVACALVSGMCLLMLSMVSALWQFYVIWAVIGATMSGCLYEPCFAIVTRARGKDAKRAIIFITLLAGFASTISFPVTHTLAENLGWRTTLVLFGVTMIVWVAPLLGIGARMVERSRGPEQKQPQALQTHRNEFLLRPAFWFLALGFTCSAFTHGATLHHLLSILNERGLSGEMAVLAASCVGPMQVVGRLVMMASEKYTSNHGVAVSAFVMMGLAIVLLMMSGSSPVLLPAFVIFFGSAYGTVSILRPLIARDILGEENFGSKSGALALPYLFGSASAPFLGSIIWAFGGYRVMLMVLLMFVFMGCSLYWIAHWLSARPRELEIIR